MSDSAETPGSSDDNSSSPPPASAPSESDSYPSPDVSSPPPSGDGDSPPPPPTSTSRSAPSPTISPPPSPPPPSLSSPAVSDSSTSPPPSPSNTTPSEAPKVSPPVPVASSTTPPPKSTPNAPSPVPVASSTTPPPKSTANAPPPTSPSTTPPTNPTLPSLYKKATPPSSDQATSPPPAPVVPSPPDSGIVSPAPNITGGAIQASPPPTGFAGPPSPPVSGAPPKPINSPPSPASFPPEQNGSISPPTMGRSPSGNSSRGSSGGPIHHSRASRNSTAQAGNGPIGDGHSTSSTTGTAVGVAVSCAVLISLVAIFFVVRSRKKRKGRAYPPRYLPPKNFTVQTNGFLYAQQQAFMGFSGPENYSYGLQNPNSPIGDSFGSQGTSLYSPDSGILGGSKAFFTYVQVMEITNGFARQNIIGEGGFGCVYKGRMQDGKIVAVKQLKAGGGQGDREFKAEVEIISRVHHRHLVSLVGYSIADNQRLLIYDFVPNKTLEHHLHSKGLPVLDWQKRLKIAIGSAKGLAYLHEDCHPKIIHRDIKSANILLDDDFEAQVADFGLARLNDTTQTHVSTRVMGTFGYLAPEYASSGKLTDRSDVFSFGVVLLELITGRKPVDPTQPLGDESLVEWARPLLIHALETGDLSELVDPRLQNHYVESEMLRMVETAAACVRHSAPKRPRMVQVVRSLDSEGEISDLSNGVKYGQSTVYDCGQYNEDIMKFRKMALGGDSSEFDPFSGDYTSRASGMPSSCDYSGGESENQAMTQRGGVGSQRKYGF